MRCRADWQYYESLSKRASVNGHAIDIYAGCLDQVGLLEMKSLANATNGFMIISDSFITAIFKQSFLRSLSKDNQDNLRMGFNGTFEVLVSAAFRDVSIANDRRRKSSRSPESSATSSPPTRSRNASARPRSVSAKRPLGRSAPSRRRPRSRRTSRSSRPRASRSDRTNPA